jgi:hypothetical protein
MIVSSRKYFFFRFFFLIHLSRRYKVSSQITRSGLVSPPITMDRRYSDFDWLYNELTKEFPGAIIPPLPEKQTVGRFSSEFIESRRRSLGLPI